MMLYLTLSTTDWRNLLMLDKRKFVIHPCYAAIIVCLLLVLVESFLPPPSRVTVWSLEDVIVIAILMLLYEGRFYVFSKEGIKVYILGIRIRNIPWSSVKRLILFDDYTAIHKKTHRHSLVVEKLTCDPPFPEEGNWWHGRTFFLLNLTCAVKIRLKDSAWQTQIKGIKQFREIDDIYTWVRED